MTPSLGFYPNSYSTPAHSTRYQQDSRVIYKQSVFYKGFYLSSRLSIVPKPKNDFTPSCYLWLFVGSVGWVGVCGLGSFPTGRYILYKAGISGYDLPHDKTSWAGFLGGMIIALIWVAAVGVTWLILQLIYYAMDRWESRSGGSLKASNPPRNSAGRNQEHGYYFKLAREIGCVIALLLGFSGSMAAASVIGSRVVYLAIDPLRAAGAGAVGGIIVGIGIIAHFFVLWSIRYYCITRHDPRSLPRV